MALDPLRAVGAQLWRQVLVVRLVEHRDDALGDAAQERLDLVRARQGAGRIVGIGDPGHVGLVVDRLGHRLEIVAVVLRRHHDRARAARLRGERIHRERVLGQHRGAAGSEEGERHQLEHVVRAVAEDDRRRVDAVARRERLLQLEAVAVGVARDPADRRLDRRASPRADAARVLVRGELDDAGFVEPHLARQLGDRLARLVRRDRAHVRGRQLTRVDQHAEG